MPCITEVTSILSQELRQGDVILAEAESPGKSLYGTHYRAIAAFTIAEVGRGCEHKGRGYSFFKSSTGQEVSMFDGQEVMVLLFHQE